MFIPSRYTVESVTSGHPDKICDQISDAILDAILAQDPSARVAIETFGAHGHLTIGGEVTTTARIDYADIARRVYRQIGYTDELNIVTHVSQQSPDIAHGVDPGGAGDQGMMYGFATTATTELLPRGLVLAHQLARRLEDVRRYHPAGQQLRPDGKTQVTMVDGRVDTVVVSAQHDPQLSLDAVRDVILQQVIRPVIGPTDGVRLHINPAGAWHIGGFTADTGLTGRKIMVDTYGGLLPHGGGAFSGKDATKVDRSAAYAARQAACWLVNNDAAQQALVSVAYAIGQAEPVMVAAIDEHGRSVTSQLPPQFDFRPAAIIERLGLRQPIFQATATYGHFGKVGLPWERS
jgi:S-adenosylmethionine synthetase